MADPAPDRERGSQRRLVEEGHGSDGAPELHRARDDRAELRCPELLPAGALEAPLELAVAVVEPGRELGLGRRRPVAERGSNRLAEQAELGGDLEIHASSRRTDSVSAPSSGAGSAGRPPTSEPSICTGPSPGWSTRATSPDAVTWASACTDSRTSTGLAGTPASARRSSRAAAESSAIGSLDPAREISLHREEALVLGDEVRSLDRRVLDAEEPGEGAALGDVQARDRDEPVARLVAAVVRVHREPAADLVGTRGEVGGGRRTSRFTRLALEPDEVLHLHRERRGEQGDVHEPPDAGRAGGDERGENLAGEEVPGGEVGERDPAGADGHRVAGTCVRREQPARACATRS